MSRSVPMWSGKTDDAMPTPRVRIRIFDAWGGRCHKCERKIRAEKWSLDHIVAVVLGGPNTEANLAPICSICLPEKNASDVAAKSAIAKTRKKHLGISTRKWRPMPGSRASGFKRHMDGRVTRR